MGCGAKKNTKKTEVDIESKIDSSLLTTSEKDTVSLNSVKENLIETKKENNIQTTIEKITIKPIDPSKPIKTVDKDGNTKDYYNSWYEQTKTTIEDKSTQDIKEKETKSLDLNSSSVDSSYFKSDTAVNNSKIFIDETNKTTPFNWNLLWWSLLIILILLLWIFRKKIPFIKNLFVN